MLDSSKPAGGSDMDWKLHALTSFFIYFVIVTFFRLPFIYSLQGLFVFVFASLLPDVDHPKSVIRKIVFIMVFYLMILSVVLGLGVSAEIKAVIMVIILVLTYYFYKNIPIRHRGRRSLHLWRYPFILMGIFLALSIFLETNISLVFFIIAGYGVHLVSDGVSDF